MAENVEITVADRLGYLVNDLNRCRQAITYRGGTVAAKEGFMDIPDSIANIPLSSSIGTVADDSLDSIKLIPSNSVPACYIKSIGGMTYKCENLMPFPYYGQDGSNNYPEMGVGEYAFSESIVTVNADRSITISRDWYGDLSNVVLNVNVASADYYLTIFKLSSEGDDNIAVGSDVGWITFGESVFIPSSTGITEIDFSIPEGDSFSCTFKIILSKYPYFEGLKDTKTTAVKVHGANLIPFPYYSKSNTTNGITTTVNDDGSITFNGIATANTVFILSNNIPLSPNESYILSADNFVEGLICSSAVRYNANLPAVYTNITFNAPAKVIAKGYKVSDLRITIASGTVCNNLVFKPMINIGTTALTYASYHEPITYDIPESLQGTGKGVEGAADTTDYENKKKDIKCKTIALGTFTDIANWNIGNYNASTGLVTIYTYVVNDYNIALRANALCSHLPYTSLQFNAAGIYFTDVIGTKYLRVNVLADVVGLTADEYTNTAVIREKIISWLTDNNVILTYALAEPTEESIDTSIFNNIPNVEAGGYLEFVTDNGFAPNSSVLFQTIP